MGDVVAFAGVDALIVVVPGPDMALVLRNGVAYGRRAAIETALGINAGLLVWALAAALGVAAVLHASGTAFTILRLAGAAYLVWLGARALLDAWRGGSQDAPRNGIRRRKASPFRQGLLSNLLNPKIALVYTTRECRVGGDPDDAWSPARVRAQIARQYAHRVAVRISWEQALAWRMRRHFLDPIGRPSIQDIVRRLCGVQAQVASSAELAIRVRRETSRRGEVDRALRDGRLIRTWAMRGTLHLLTPEDAGAFLSLIASGRSWERQSWQRYFGVTPKQIEALRGAARSALSDGPLTREELAKAVAARRGLRHVGEGLGSSWGTLLKPLAWQGDLCSGPNRGNRATFMLPEQASSRWGGVPEPDDAAPVAIAAYLRAYGPATSDSFGNWLAGGWFGKRRLHAWFRGLHDRLAEVDVDGERAYVLAEDLDELVATPPTRAVRLLPGFDQYVLGPGTADGRVVPAGRRAAVSRQAGWISPVVVVGGVVRGTWELNDEEVPVAWFGEAGRPPRAALKKEVARLSSIVGRDLQPTIGVAR